MAENVMKVSKEKAVKVFEYFGFKTASKWNAEKMTSKLTNLLESIDPKAKIKSKKVKTFVDELLAADSIVVTAKKKNPESEETTDKDKGKGKDKDKGEKADKKTTAKKTKEKTGNRLEASVQVLTKMGKKGMTVEESIQACDDVYVKMGGTSNLNEARPSFKRTARVLELVSIITFSEDRKTVKPT